MDDQNLRQLLEQLHTELKQTPIVDEKGRLLLESLLKDISELLERSEDDPILVKPSLLEQIEESINIVELEHPTLTSTLSNILESLSNAGI